MNIAASFIPWIASCLLITGAGASLTLQQVLNTRLRAELMSPWWAGAGSYLVGTVLMVTIASTSTWLHPSQKSLWALIRYSSPIS